MIRHHNKVTNTEISAVDSLTQPFSLFHLLDTEREKFSFLLKVAETDLLSSNYSHVTNNLTNKKTINAIAQKKISDDNYSYLPCSHRKVFLSVKNVF